MKTIIKIVLFLIVFFVLANVFWMIFIKKGFSASNECLMNESIKIKQFTEEARNMPSGSERNKYICSQDYESFSQLVSCWSDSKKANPFSFMVYSNLPKYKNLVTETIAGHNGKCPESQIAWPNF